MGLRAGRTCTLLLLLAGCRVHEAGAGDRCTRSSQCTSGLACIEQRCSDDLAGIAEQSSVPELMPVEELDAALLQDGANDGAAP